MGWSWLITRPTGGEADLQGKVDRWVQLQAYGRAVTDAAGCRRTAAP
jgi:hypothetical protein